LESNEVRCNEELNSVITINHTGGSTMKKQLVVLSAAAIVAAAAVPALAFENEFHGIYRLRANVTNAMAVGSEAFKDEARTNTVFEQRARLQYIAKASADLKLVTFFEVDSSWGDAAYNNGRATGAGAGGDSVNLETKNVYLDFKIPSTPVQMKVGLQGWMDAYKGIIYYNDLAGALATAKLDAFTATGAFFRTYDQGGNSTIGKKNVDLYVLDGKFAINKDTTLGASYYNFFNDTKESGTGEAAMTHTIGVNFASKLGIVGVDAFFLGQTGDALYDFQTTTNKTKDVSAWAAQVAANANLGMATVRGAFLYTSGDDRKDADESNAFQVVQENAATTNPPTFSAQGGSYYSSQMMLLFRNIYNMDSDVAIVPNLNNGNHGVMAGFLGADFKINDKFTANANLGFAMNAENQDTDLNGTEDDDYLGTEINLSLNYKLYPTLTATLQGAYVMLGDYYDNSGGAGKDPDDPYLTGLMLNYTF
jgi:hypothetical protein